MDTQKVTVSFNSLITSLQQHEETVAVGIADLASKRDWSKVNEQTEIAKQLKIFIQRIEGLKNDWGRLIDAAPGENITLASDEDIPIEERTTWARIGDKIRVETEGGNSVYSNIIPVNLFVVLAMEAYNYCLLNGFVKTSHVLSGLKETIMELSEYKSESSVRLPVYVTFKVLLKEGLFIKLDSHRNQLAPGRQVDFFAFLAKIDNPVSHSEAVRRLFAAGKPEMAEALKDYNTTSTSKDNKGWDGSVSGSDGELYKRFGEDMRKIIWPYRTF